MWTSPPTPRPAQRGKEEEQSELCSLKGWGPVNSRLSFLDHNFSVDAKLFGAAFQYFSWWNEHGYKEFFLCSWSREKGENHTSPRRTRPTPRLPESNYITGHTNGLISFFKASIGPWPNFLRPIKNSGAEVSWTNGERSETPTQHT